MKIVGKLMISLNCISLGVAHVLKALALLARGRYGHGKLWANLCPVGVINAICHQTP